MRIAVIVPSQEFLNRYSISRCEALRVIPRPALPRHIQLLRSVENAACPIQTGLLMNT